MLLIEKLALSGLRKFSEHPPAELITGDGVLEEYLNPNETLFQKGDIETMYFFYLQSKIRIHDNNLTLAVLENEIC